jgi:hypothetical protein
LQRAAAKLPGGRTSPREAGTFAVSAVLTAVGAATAVLLREEGRGERINLLDLQAGQ